MKLLYTFLLFLSINIIFGQTTIYEAGMTNTEAGDDIGATYNNSTGNFDIITDSAPWTVNVDDAMAGSFGLFRVFDSPGLTQAALASIGLTGTLIWLSDPIDYVNFENINLSLLIGAANGTSSSSIFTEYSTDGGVTWIQADTNGNITADNLSAINTNNAGTQVSSSIPDATHTGQELLLRVTVNINSSNTTMQSFIDLVSVTGTPRTVPTLEFASTTASVDEGVGTVEVTVTANTAPAAGLLTFVTVQLDDASSTATAGAANDHDYEANTALMFDPMNLTQTITIAITDDTIEELDETIVLRLENPSNALIGTDSLHTITITANDTATLSASEVNPENVKIYIDKNNILQTIGYDFSEVNIYDLNGRLVGETYNLAYFKSGVYIAELLADNGVRVTKKFIR